IFDDVGLGPVRGGRGRDEQVLRGTRRVPALREELAFVTDRDPATFKAELLANPVEHVDITAFDARPLIRAYSRTAFQARNLAAAADIVDRMQADHECAVIMTLAGSLISAGMKEAMITLVENDMVDAIVSTGANIVDQDFFEGLGFRHYI